MTSFALNTRTGETENLAMRFRPTVREINAHLASMRNYASILVLNGQFSVRITRARTHKGQRQYFTLNTGIWLTPPVDHIVELS